MKGGEVLWQRLTLINTSTITTQMIMRSYSQQRQLMERDREEVLGNDPTLLPDSGKAQ